MNHKDHQDHEALEKEVVDEIYVGSKLGNAEYNIIALSRQIKGHKSTIIKGDVARF